MSQTQPDATASVNCYTPAIVEDILSFSGVSVLSRVPKGARNQAAAALTSLINNVCESNSPEEWRKLFRFTAVCFNG